MMLALREHILMIRLSDFRLSAGEMQILLNPADDMLYYLGELP